MEDGEVESPPIHDRFNSPDSGRSGDDASGPISPSEVD